MGRSGRTTLLASAALLTLSVLVVAACGGAATPSRPASTSPTAKTSSPGSATVGVSDSGLGSILVDSQDRTLFPVAGRHRAQEHLQRRLRRGLASAFDHRGAHGCQRRESVTPR